MKRTLTLLSLLVLLLTGCGGQAPAPADTPAPVAPAAEEFDPRGVWQYTLIADNGNTYDTGTIIFSGGMEAGTYTQMNLYNVEYEGEYTYVDGIFTLQGAQIWTGSFADADHMSGTFESPVDAASGTWIATRQP